MVLPHQTQQAAGSSTRSYSGTQSKFQVKGAAAPPPAATVAASTVVSKGNQPAVTSKAARQGSTELESGSGGRQSTDVGALMDAVGTSGLDIGAEEEALRLAHERNQAATPSVPQHDRSRRQDFIDSSALAEVVKRIAGTFSLKTLEPDTIPFIALAVRHRLMSLINDSVAARDHRVTATHLRSPPFVAAKRKRRDDDEEGEGEDEDDDEDAEADEDDLMGLGTTTAKKERELVPAWDHAILDDQEKILAVLERVDREEERRRRRERMIRDEREREAQELAEAIAATEAEEAEEDAAGEGTSMGRGGGASSATPGPSSRIGSPAPDGSMTPQSKRKYKKKVKDDGTTTPVVKKKKILGPAVTARTMSEDVRKRLSDQTAMRSAGGRTFSWLNPGAGGGSGSGSSKLASFGSPTPGGASGTPFSAKPMFAPSYSLPAPTFGTPSRASGLQQSTTALGALNSHPLSRLAHVPPLHDASRAFQAKEEWEQRKKQVELGDMVWALERERGMGVNGRKSLMRTVATRKQ